MPPWWILCGNLILPMAIDYVYFYSIKFAKLNLTDLGSGDAIDTGLFCELSGLSGGYAVDVSFLYNRCKSRLVVLIGVHKERNISSLSNLWTIR